MKQRFKLSSKPLQEVSLIYRHLTFPEDSVKALERTRRGISANHRRGLRVWRCLGRAGYCLSASGSKEYDVVALGNLCVDVVVSFPKVAVLVTSPKP